MCIPARFYILILTTSMRMFAGPFVEANITVYFPDFPPNSYPDQPLFLSEQHFAETVTLGSNNAHASAQATAATIGASAGGQSHNWGAVYAWSTATFFDRWLVTGGQGWGTVSLTFEVDPRIPITGGPAGVFCAFDECFGWGNGDPTFFPGVTFRYPSGDWEEWLNPPPLTVTKAFQFGSVLDVSYAAKARIFSSGGDAIGGGLTATLIGVRIESSQCPGCALVIESESGMSYNALTAIPEPALGTLAGGLAMAALAGSRLMRKRT